jgi:hypothetical protein
MRKSVIVITTKGTYQWKVVTHVILDGKVMTHVIRDGKVVTHIIRDGKVMVATVS